jgi:hypothetical protein
MGWIHSQPSPVSPPVRAEPARDEDDSYPLVLAGIAIQDMHSDDVYHCVV